MTSMRTRKASMTMPAASARPNCLIIASWLKMKPANTAVMMIAAATTTRLAWSKPCTTAPTPLWPWTWASRIEVTRKTW